MRAWSLARWLVAMLGACGGDERARVDADTIAEVHVDTHVAEDGEDGEIRAEPCAELVIDFPPSGATTAATIVIHGRVTTCDAIAGLTVAGVAAALDGAGRWSAEVPLALGANALDVSLVSGRPFDFPGPVITRATTLADITRGSGAWPGRALGLAWEAFGARVILTDDYGDGVVEVDPVSGDRTTLSDSESGAGPGAGYAIVQPTAVAAAGEAAWVVDTPYLVRIDLVSGDRALVPGEPHDATGIARDPVAVGRVLTLSGDALVSVDPTTGERATVASGLTNAVAFAVDEERAKAYVLIVYQDRLIEVDLATGAHADLLLPGEPRLGDPRVVAVAGDAIVIWDDDHLVKVDARSGARTLLGGGGPELLSVHGLDVSPLGLMAIDYVPAWEGEERAPMLVAIDPLNGTRVVVAR